MPVSVPSYLKLSRHNVFYFRWLIPARLRPRGRPLYVETSLRTRNPRLALQMARHLAYHAENITGCMLDMNHAEIKAALQAFFANKLEEFKKRREQAGFLSKPLEDQYTHILEALEQANSQGLDARVAFDDSEAFHQRIDEIIQDRKLNIPKDTHEYDTLVREHNFAYAQYLRDMLAHNDSVKTYTLTPDKTITIQPTNLSGVSLKQAVADFIADRQRGEAWTPRTSKERTVQLALLCEILGENTDIASIDVRKVDEAMSILNALPKHRSKNPKTRGLPLKQIVAMTDVEKMNPRTVNEYVTVYQSLFSWAERRSYIAKNYFDGRQIKLKKNKAPARMPFSRDQIKTILAALPEHTPEISGKSFRYWGVMLAIYTGARLNEIAQLALDDIQQEGGIWYFNITDEGDDDNKRLKNASSKRRVPIHDALLSQGILQRIEDLRKKKQTRLFPDLDYQEGHGYGRELTRWNSRLLVKLGIKAQGLSFHSFRHSFITNLRQAGVELPTVQELAGHSKDVVTETVYNASAYPLPTLKTAVDKLNYI